MKVLAIDGALGGFSAAVVRDEAVVATRQYDVHQALERGLTAIESVLTQARIQPHQLDRLAVGVGPGGFTGLRIAIALAKSLAMAWSLPVVAVSSFDAIEEGRRHAAGLAVVAGRPGVISARYRRPDASTRASGRIDQVLRELLLSGDSRLAVVGAAEDVLAALAERGIVVDAFDPLYTPPAAAIGRIAQSRAAESSSHAVRADYGELPAATERERPKTPE